MKFEIYFVRPFDYRFLSMSNEFFLPILLKETIPNAEIQQKVKYLLQMCVSKWKR